ncbi:MAG: hypothetical protein WAR59_10460 [Ignavibacteriaceae bacterium]
MKYFDWDDSKNRLLKKERNISFEEVVLSISNNGLLDVLEHPNQKKYPNQKMFIVNINEYAHIVPFVEDEYKYFLKTIYKSREATKIYLKRKES